MGTMSSEETALFVGYEIWWNPRPCPLCKTRIATALGVFYTDPVAETSDPGNKRAAVGEIYHHAQGDDCRRMF